jgi:TolB-like protein
MALLTELRNRGVLRAAAWYAAAAWVLIQVASTVFPQFDLPTWSVRAVIVIALLGLPVALLAAWVFEITPAGIRRTDSADENARAMARGPLWREPSLWIALAAGALFVIGAQQAWQRLVKPSFGEGPRLAVLPFANLSPAPEHAYFADGLHEEVLSNLAHVPSLRLISRTSVLEYRDTTRKLRDIARDLDVPLIVEGSVRRAGDEVRITLQLIDARTDEHLWAKTYDRTFRDVLRLQELVAQQITGELSAALSIKLQPTSARAGTAVPEAYDRYIHALALFEGSDEMEPVLALLDEAIALDPEFAQAYAQRARIRVYSLAGGFISAEAAEHARADIERALALQPGLPEALVARGVYLTYVTRDPERAIEEVRRALAVNPSSVHAHSIAAATLRRLGRADEALIHFEQAALLDPASHGRRIDYVSSLLGFGRFDEAQRVLQQAIERFPAWPGPRLAFYNARFQATGMTDGWREAHARLYSQGSNPLGDSGPQTWIMLTCLGDFAGLISMLEEGDAGGMYLGTREYQLGMTYLAAGNKERARPLLTAVAERRPEPGRAESPQELVERAVALDLIGRSREALRTADAAIPLLPKHDATNNPSVYMTRSWVLIRSGVRAEEGYSELKRWLGSWGQQPRWISVSLPWVLLRDDARTQQIIRDALSK